MGKRINFRASNDPYMFQFFKRFVHHQGKGEEYYVDGSYVNENVGVVIDFLNIEHTYEIFKVLENYWGGWNATPSSQEMYEVAKKWEETYSSEIIDIGYDTIDFSLGRELSDEEIDKLFDEIRELNAEANCRGGFETLRTIIKKEQMFCIWWD